MPLVEVVEGDGDVVVLTLANADRRNSLTIPMLAALATAIDDAQAAGCRVLVLRAEPGATTWCAGFDISALPDQVPSDWEHPMDHVLGLISRAPFPVIAAVEGGVWGGGFELVLACDLVVAVRSATFAITPARLGVAYGTEGVARFAAALPASLVNELFFTAEPVSAEELHRLGLINRLVDDEEQLTAQAGALAAVIAERAPLTIRSVKAEIAALATATARLAEGDERLAGLRRAAWDSADYREGREAFAERRAPRFTGR